MCDVERGNDEENFGFLGSGFRVLPGRDWTVCQGSIVCVSFYKINVHKRITPVYLYEIPN